jgi:hypothetical protein
MSLLIFTLLSIIQKYYHNNLNIGKEKIRRQIWNLMEERGRR